MRLPADAWTLVLEGTARRGDVLAVRAVERTANAAFLTLLRSTHAALDHAPSRAPSAGSSSALSAGSSSAPSAGSSSALSSGTLGAGSSSAPSAGSSSTLSAGSSSALSSGTLGAGSSSVLSSGTLGVGSSSTCVVCGARVDPPVAAVRARAHRWCERGSCLLLGLRRVVRDAVRRQTYPFVDWTPAAPLWIPRSSGGVSRGAVLHGAPLCFRNGALRAHVVFEGHVRFARAQLDARALDDVRLTKIKTVAFDAVRDVARLQLLFPTLLHPAVARAVASEPARPLPPRGRADDADGVERR